MSDVCRENACNEVNIIMRCSMLFPHDIIFGDSSAAEADAGNPREDDEPEPDIKPPLPQEIPAPQAPQPEISPYQPPQPADPGTPQPEA